MYVNKIISKTLAYGAKVNSELLFKIRSYYKMLFALLSTKLEKYCLVTSFYLIFPKCWS